MNLLRAEIFLILMLLFVTACGKSKNKADHKNQTQIQKYYYNGDVQNLYLGTKRNNNLRVEDLSKFEKTNLIGIMEFKEKVPQTSYEEIVKGQEPKTRDGSSIRKLTCDTNMKKNTYHFECQIDEQDKILDLSFSKKSEMENNLKVENAWGFDEKECELVHFSFKGDFSSLLLHCKDEHNSSLYALYLKKQNSLPHHENKKIFNSDDKYKYLFKNVRWSQEEPLVFTICKNGFSGDELSVMKESFATWKPVLSNRLDFNFIEKDDCPPFSDLNTKGIYSTRDFLGQYSLGLTCPIPDYKNEEMVLAPIFIFTKNHEKHSRYEKFNALKKTGTHEMGHALGLDHIFNGTQSIMSYDEIPSDAKLTSYDLEALKNLYPLIIEP